MSNAHHIYARHKDGELKHIDDVERGEKGQTPIYSNDFPAESKAEMNIGTFKDTSGQMVNNIERSTGIKWMKRYSSGIRFEFYPPN